MHSFKHSFDHYPFEQEKRGGCNKMKMVLCVYVKKFQSYNIEPCKQAQTFY